MCVLLTRGDRAFHFPEPPCVKMYVVRPTTDAQRSSFLPNKRRGRERENEREGEREREREGDAGAAEDTRTSSIQGGSTGSTFSFPMVNSRAPKAKEKYVPKKTEVENTARMANRRPMMATEAAFVPAAAV